MRRALTPHRLAVAGLILLLTIVVVGNGWDQTFTDIKPEIYYAPAAMVGHYLSSWTATPYLGSPNFNVGLAPVVLALAPLDLLGFSAKAIFLLSHLALWLIAGTGAARLARALSPAASPWTGLATAVCYVANPYAVVGGSTLAVLLPYALLPWMAYALVRALREPASWRWPAAAALAFFAQSGMNVAVIPIFQLLAVPPIALAVGRAAGLTWRRIGLVLAKCAVFVAGVSLYWLLPSLTATATGQQIVAGSETVDGIARVSSLTEVLRGLGIWTLYGTGPDGPWVPQYAAYETNSVIVVASLLWPVVALLALVVAGRTLRRTAALLIGTGAVTMVGLYAAAGPTPIALLVARLFDTISPLLAFRTTNKAGAVLTLGFTLALGHAVPIWWRPARSRVRMPRPARRWALPAALTALVAGWVYPALTGNLYTSPIDIPAYWRQAAAAVDAQPHDTRVLLLPAQTRPTYRWTDERPDDVTNSLVRREAIIPETTPNTSAPGGNFLAALGDLFGTGVAGPDTLSTMARYLGAGDILLRHDVAWEDVAGPRPALTSAEAGADPGLRGVANFGAPGENVAGKAAPVGLEHLLSPVQLYAVRDPLTTVSARPLTGNVVVAGDGWAYDALARSGLLPGSPVVRFAADLASATGTSAGSATAADPAGIGTLISAAARLVLTDTNRRQSVIPNRLTAGFGPLLPADATPAGTRALGGAADQTVLVREGPAIRASQVGAAFFETPYGEADNALDGDPATAWLFGDFRRAPGVTLDVSFTRPQTLHTVTIRPAALGPVHLDRVTLTAGGVSREVTLPDTGVASVDFGGVAASGVRLRVDSIRGDGYSLVGIAELGLPGPKVRRIGRLPLSFTAAYAALDPAAKARVDGIPLDVLLSRVRNAAGSADDSETTLERDITLPDARAFTTSATVRVPSASIATYDALSGLDPSVRVRASSVLLDNPDLRASMAVDGDLRTGWVPSGIVGSWWEISGKARMIERVAITQRRVPQAGVDAGRIADRVRIEVDGRVVATARLTAGVNPIRLRKPLRGKVVRVEFTRESGTGSPPQIVDIDTGLRPAVSRERPCVTVAEVDGLPVRMRPSLPIRLADHDSPGTSWEGCSPETDLAAGTHTVRSVRDYQLDTFALRDRQGVAPVPAASPRAVSTTGSTTDMTITLDVGPTSVALKIGEGYDARWVAEVDGRSLGTPVVIDGWSVGWILDQAGRHTVHVWFAPQRAATIGAWVSGLTVLGCALLVGMPFRLRRLAFAAAVGRRSRTEGAGASAPLTAWPLARRWLPVGVVAAGGFAFGIPGLVGALVVVATRRRLTARRQIIAGAVVVAAAGLLQIVLAIPSWGSVDALVTAHSAWPHVVAAAGLVIALAGAMRARPEPAERAVR
ncbi:MAG: alpha-(1-_3)-arabinofuranosyltransferase family protein [Dermatophilaceae bacterium]